MLLSSLFSHPSIVNFQQIISAGTIKILFFWALVLISCECFTSPTFFIVAMLFWLAHHKKIETMEAPQYKRFYWKMECFTLWPTYIGEKGGLWTKHMGLNQGAVGNTLGELIGNLGNILRTWWELIGNLKGTQKGHVGNRGKMKKILAPPKT